MPVLHNIVAMVQASDVSESAAFYEKLGFTLGNTFQPQGELAVTWATLARGHAQLMLTRAEEPIVAAAQRVLFYLYFEDVPETRAELVASGIECGPIATPFYAPQGEFEVVDPDGYVLMLTHT